jgi:hypothetical protein
MEFRGTLKEVLENLRSCTSPSVSNSNECDIILDSSSLKLKKSINGGSYVDLGGGGSGFSSMQWFCTIGNNAVPALTAADPVHGNLNLSLVYAPGDISAKLIRLVFLLTNSLASGSTRWSNTFTISLALYTKNGNTFSTASSTTISLSFSVSRSGDFGYAYFIQTNFTVNLVGGSAYLIGVVGSRQNTSGFTAHVVGQRLRGYIGHETITITDSKLATYTTTSGMTYSLRGLIADGTAGTRFPAPFVGGRYSITTLAIPASIINTQIITAQGGYTIPYILFTSIDPETGESL